MIPSQWVPFGLICQILASIESPQVQRGVGTSTNGSGVFGASINILTDIVSDQPYAELSSSFEVITP